jgi:protein-tyrosine phosphatase
MAVGCLRVLVQRAGRTGAFEIDSAGTYEGANGQPPSLLAQEAAARRGYPIRDLRARRLEPADLARFDYAMAMDRIQLAAMRLVAPGALTERLQMLLKYVPVLGVREIRDPFGGTTQDYERALDLIECGCAGLLEHIGKETGLPGHDAPSDGRGRATRLRVVHSRD